MWWWGFDFGQIFGGFNRKEIEARLRDARSRGDAAAQPKPRELRARNVAARKRARDERAARRAGAVAGRRSELAAENAQIKEELAFLQKLVADSSKQAGLSIQRLAVERDARRRLALQPAGRARRQARRTSSTATSTLQATLRPHPTAHDRRR